MIRITKKQAAEIREAVQVGAGTVSVCWLPKPTGVFQSEVALRTTDQIISKIYKTLDLQVVEYSCKACGEPIDVTIFRGGDWCSDDCRKALVETHV